MKIKLLLLFFFAGFSGIRAQNYYPLVDTGKVWASTSCGYGWSVVCVTNYFKMDQDSVIGGHTYKDVWFSSDSGLVNPTWFLRGFMREDAAKKVFYRALNDTNDYPMYDFAVTSGDTAHLIYNGSPLNLVVDSMRTIVLQNQTRKVYYLHDPTFSFGYYQTWIEGIGSLDELLFTLMLPVDYSSDLLCFHQNDTLYYANPDYTDCYYNTTGLEDHTSGNSIHLFPNPGHEKFTLSFEKPVTPGKADLTVLDVSGKIILQQEISFTQKTELDLSGLPAGIYFVQLTNADHTKLSAKVAVY